MCCRYYIGESTEMSLIVEDSCVDCKETKEERVLSHYKQIVINLACEDDLQEVDLQILKEKVEECLNINADPEKITEIRVRVNRIALLRLQRVLIRLRQ